MPIEISHEHLEFTPSFAKGDDCDSFADMLTNSGRLNNVAALDGSQHREDNRAILAAPHDMILEFFSVDQRTWDRCDVDERSKLSKL